MKRLACSSFSSLFSKIGRAIRAFGDDPEEEDMAASADTTWRLGRDEDLEGVRFQ